MAGAAHHGGVGEVTRHAQTPRMSIEPRWDMGAPLPAHDVSVIRVDIHRRAHRAPDLLGGPDVVDVVVGH